MKESNEDTKRILLMDFGTVHPLVAGWPNCLFRASPAALATVLKVAGESAGLWGITPPFSDDLEFNSYAEEFYSWGLSANQQYLRESAWGLFVLEPFTMVIPLNTSKDVIQRMMEESVDGDCFEDLENLAYWIDDLGWAYVPLKLGEFDHILLSVGKSRSEMIDRVVNELTDHDLKVARLRLGSGRVDWVGPYDI